MGLRLSYISHLSLIIKETISIIIFIHFLFCLIWEWYIWSFRNLGGPFRLQTIQTRIFIIFFGVILEINHVNKEQKKARLIVKGSVIFCYFLPESPLRIEYLFHLYYVYDKFDSSRALWLLYGVADCYIIYTMNEISQKAFLCCFVYSQSILTFGDFQVSFLWILWVFSSNLELINNFPKNCISFFSICEIFLLVFTHEFFSKYRNILFIILDENKELE